MDARTTMVGGSMSIVLALYGSPFHAELVHDVRPTHPKKR